MKLTISIPEVVDIFKEIQEQPEPLYEMIRSDIRETIGQYLSGLMDLEPCIMSLSGELKAKR